MLASLGGEADYVGGSLARVMPGETSGEVMAKSIGGSDATFGGTQCAEEHQ